jgi:hypothetical protein
LILTLSFPGSRLAARPKNDESPPFLQPGSAGGFGFWIDTTAGNALFCRLAVAEHASSLGVRFDAKACQQSDGKWRIFMKNLKHGAIGATGLALLLSIGTASAQQPLRVRGTIEKVDGNNLTVKTREGGDITVKLAANATVTGVAKAVLSDVKQNSFIGITAMPQPDGTQKAIEVHIFPEARRGAGEGYRPWDLVPNSTMTNANVEQLVTSVDGPMLTMKYKDGEKKIFVPNNAVIVEFVNGDKADLKPGAKIFIGAGTKQPDGSIETAGINVGKDGLTPPM